MSNAVQPDPQILDKLRRYEALLHKWQKAVNLVGPATLPDSWQRHFVDSMQLAALLPEEKKTLYDLGSGAGFPGLVLAIMRPDMEISLIESDQKKCAFLSTVSHETKTPVKILARRIEQVAESLPPPDIVTARALASLPELLRLIKPWAEKNPDLVCLFPKGAQAEAEIEAARGVAAFEVVLHQSITEPAARILALQNIRF